MQSLVLPPTALVSTQFGHPRFSSASERLALNYTLPTNARLCNPRDLPPVHPMSSSVPAEDPLETARHVRPTPHTTGLPTVTAVSVTAPAVTTASVSETALASGSSGPATGHTSAFQQYVAPVTREEIRPPFIFNETAPNSQAPLGTTEQRAAQEPSTTFPSSNFGASPPARELLPKGTRRTKAHVASACVNCKKKHLGCDPARPCRRCVLSGKEATCVDVTHKKRGRPPLKAEDASLRTYASQAENATTSGEQQTPLPRRTHTHRSTGSREIRPVTDLRMPGTSHGAVGFRAPPGHPHRWSTSVFPHVVDPSLSMQANLGHRRFSSSGSIPQMTVATPPGFIPLTSGFSPALNLGRTQMGAGRPLSSYTHQGLPPTTSPPQYQQPFGVPMPPYTASPRMVSRLPAGETREAYPESPVRLPPIFPPAMAHSRPTPQAHRLSDPYPAAWSPRLREELMQPQPQQQTGGSSPQSFMEPISPATQTRHAALEHGHSHGHGHGDLGSQQSNPTVQGAQNLSTQSSPARPRDEQPAGGPETGESRPTKRRKMALDDMVND
ncbi:hypothetical protein Asppvi_011026 [Aspergillus pseudoviridinutans]|uniref:Transcription activator of gluconeogenesis acuK n=1 Tax=Aspergillus pseudoviridinutans TaxID=1517512 RepID=A0A9P3EXK4_9EURO|nr:uncharacterized protein Asppvi_011026 [Aspergillus pseudoviridinutans]GIJ92051.1 hypothetical protein Asppvi_011026 [Aspergillus pseudoviridinutans]